MRNNTLTRIVFILSLSLFGSNLFPVCMISKIISDPIYYIKNSELLSLFQLCIQCGCSSNLLPFANVMVSQCVVFLFKRDNSYIENVTVTFLFALIKCTLTFLQKLSYFVFNLKIFNHIILVLLHIICQHL